MITPLSPYRSLATVKGQPFSFSRRQLEGKKADLGPTIYSALYMQQPVSQEAQMFPPEVWGLVEQLNLDDFSLIVSAWDTASKDKATNDPSVNVLVGRRHAGDFVVLDVCEFRLKFDLLLPVVLERYRRQLAQFRRTPIYLCIEDASSGQQLLQVIEAEYPELPLLVGKPKSQMKQVRAEGITPYTSARSVSLLQAAWNEQFILDMANFPASDRDHSVDAFVYAMKAFVGTGYEFEEPRYLPAAPEEESFDQWERENAISPQLDDIDRGGY